MEKIKNSGIIASLQPPYNMLRRDIENDQLPYCRENNIGVICYSPMERGLLTGKITKEWAASLAEDDHRKRDDRFNEPQLSANLWLVDELKKIANDKNITISQLAIAWVIKDEMVTAAIAGGRKPEQIKEAYDGLLNEPETYTGVVLDWR